MKITMFYTMIPSEDYPGHSYVRSEVRKENGELVGTGTMYGPVPDVLVDELIHEIKTGFQTSVNSTINNLFRKE